jgi:small-conductance mechanosensitive channel
MGRRALMPFLQGNTALVIGLLLLIFVGFARALASEQQLKADLRGALGWLVTWLALRLLDYALDALGLVALDKASRVIWMLAFAFGAVRTTVAFGLWTYRRINVGGTPKILRDVLDFVLYFVAAIPILKTQLDIDLASLLATSAILSVVLGLALQESLGNVFSGLALQLERPFRAGDWISVGEHEGRVVHVAWRATRIETFRSEEVTLPNSNLAKQPVRNYTRGGQPVALDLEVGVSYATPPNVVREEVVSALADVALILKAPAPVCLVSRFGDSAVLYLVRFYIADYRSQPEAVDQAYTRLWYRFSRAGIEIPYPQRAPHAALGPRPVHAVLRRAALRAGARCGRAPVRQGRSAHPRGRRRAYVLRDRVGRGGRRARRQ